MTRYTEQPGGYEMDSRQDEGESPCASCLTWTLEELLEPCRSECAEMLRGEVERMAAE